MPNAELTYPTTGQRTRPPAVELSRWPVDVELLGTRLRASRATLHDLGDASALAFEVGNLREVPRALPRRILATGCQTIQCQSLVDLGGTCLLDQAIPLLDD